MVQNLHHVNGKITPVSPHPQHHVEPTGKPASFDQILENQLERPDDLKFSVHAQERIMLRNIPLGSEGVQRLRNGVDQIAAKGGKESLVLMDNAAFLVSVKNRTVITAIAQDGLKNNVFTNIDSTIVV